MASVNEDLEKLRTALAAIGEKAASDDAYRQDLQSNQVSQLRAAGVSAMTLAGVFAQEGADEAEVAAYGMTLTSTGGSGDPDEFISSRFGCIGTCTGPTFVFCCLNSIRPRL